FRMDSFDDPRRVLATQKKNDAANCVVYVILSKNPMTFLVAQLQRAKIAHKYRCAVALRDDNIAKIVQCLHETDAANDKTKVAAGDHAAAGVGAVGLDGVCDILERNIEADQGCRIEFELEQSGDPPERGDIRNAWYLLESRNYHPALNFGQLPQSVGIGLQRVAVDFADRRGKRIETRGDPRRERDVLNALEDSLPRPVILGAVAKDECNQGQSEGALRAD